MLTNSADHLLDVSGTVPNGTGAQHGPSRVSTAKLPRTIAGMLVEHRDESLADLASQAELSQRMRSQLAQRGLCVLGARLVAKDADANLALDAPGQHGQ